MPLCCAHATPATDTFPAFTDAPSVGTSMRDSVLIGPIADQPRGTQYPCAAANVVTSRSTTHLHADTYPYRPGTTRRAGNPCAVGSAAPFIATATRASRPSSTTESGVPEVNPSTDVASSWSAPRCGRASRRSDGEGRAEPLRVADVRAADRVGDAAQREVVLDQRPVQQLVEGDRDLAGDHPVNAQRPVGRVHLRDEEGGVDAVELAIRRDKRGNARARAGSPRPAAAARARRPWGTGSPTGPGTRSCARQGPAADIADRRRPRR